MAQVLARGDEQARLAPPSIRSSRPDLTASIDSVKVKLDRLEHSSALLDQDADIVLAGLRALEGKVAALKSQFNASPSGEESQLSQLLVRTQRLIRKVVAEQTIRSRERSQLPTTAASRHAAMVPSGAVGASKTDGASPFFVSSSAMGRFLEESLAWQKRQLRRQGTSEAALPSAHHGSPAARGSEIDPRLPLRQRIFINDEVEDDDSLPSSQRPQADEEEALAQYEQQAHLRHRGQARGLETEASARDTRTRGPDTAETTSRHDEKKAGSTTPFTPSPMLSTERTTQEALSHELLRMASALKTQSVSFSSALERDRKLLESADEKLLANLDVMTRTRGRLGEYAHKARGMGWFTLATVAIVVATWVVMFVIIRLT
ncbi:unnamed protein product [Parajaminaea phylloscopi]